jgi:hypothetical protein
VFPDAVQKRSEAESENKYGLLAENVHVVLGIVVFNVPVTVTQVPAGPAEGNRLMVAILKSVAVARAGVGTTTEYTEMNRADVNNNSRRAELTLRVGNLTHALLIS